MATLSKPQTIVLRVLQILAAVAFLAAGGMKLAGAGQSPEMFGKIGLGQGFRYLTGGLEVLGALGLLYPGSAFYSALLLVAVMAGAVVTHLVVLGGSPAAAVVLLAVTAAIAYLRRP